MYLVHNALLLLIALAVDAAFGDPAPVWRRLAHPVVVMGRAIGWLDKRLNRLELDEATRRRRGVVALVVIIAGAALVGGLIARTFGTIPFGVVLEGAVASILIAQRSLHDHVAAVGKAFAAGGLDAARQAVSMIVGRDPKRLDEAGVSRAAIESCAENFADGVVAPAFWCLLFGLPGLFAYKAINTADSMIGHKTELHRAFGWASARFDDLVNLIPARLSGLVVVIAALLTGRDARAGLAAMGRDARRHASPNAGWPESAMGGALGLALGGPRVYSGALVDDPWMNAGGRQAATPADLIVSLKLFRAACLVHAGLIALVLGAALLAAR
ncbi:adenosylcobinamide-phosphate synthase CbiB [Hansschlegelia plantiphila]|uniref:Cobalamin biosynthesis protein CobD n=1 Tax=Hansschlegelia plantiphila TaxID=374655 RepID=A0A9W6IYK7_9HYPH|nr:adenosylcobinamide-phosphate synthase CbiB [Hansschlegelia plantiphila]GLK67516.1 cobalamin biosynthesis protein CobD [Hansschlegelia plantiphila]